MEESKLRVYVTGFGKFGNIEHNPTTVLVEGLSKSAGLKCSLEHLEVAEVSIQGCENTLQKIGEKIEERSSQDGGSNDKYLILNLGVAANRKDFCLEHRAKNIKDFRIPDMAQNQPKNERIDCSKNLDDCLEQGFCDLDSVAEAVS